MAKHLIEFYGDECIACQEMKPLTEKLEKELGIKIAKKEVWHNEKNAKLFQEHDKGRCGSIPFFINTKTGEYICGKADYKKLKKWAQGE